MHDQENPIYKFVTNVPLELSSNDNSANLIHHIQMELSPNEFTDIVDPIGLVDKETDPYLFIIP